MRPGTRISPSWLGGTPPKPDTLKQTDHRLSQNKALADGAGHTLLKGFLLGLDRGLRVARSRLLDRPSQRLQRLPAALRRALLQSQLGGHPAGDLAARPPPAVGQRLVQPHAKSLKQFRLQNRRLTAIAPTLIAKRQRPSRIVALKKLLNPTQSERGDLGPFAWGTTGAQIKAQSIVNTGLIESGGANGGVTWLIAHGSIVNNGTFLVPAGGASGLTQFFVDTASFVNNGTVSLASPGGIFAICSSSVSGANGFLSSPMTTTGTGTINLTSANDRLDLAGTQTFVQGTINLSGSGEILAFDWTGDVQTFGVQSTINQSAGRANFVELGSAQVIENGALNASAVGGALNIALQRFTNNGVISVSNGDTLRVNSGASPYAFDGAGSVNLATGAAVEIGGTTAATQSIVFRDAASVHLKLDASSTFVAAVHGFALGDLIDLTNIAATSASWANNVLTVAEGNGSSLALLLLGNYASAAFAVSSDGSTGSNIALAAAPTPGALSGAFGLTSVAEDAPVAGAIATFADTKLTEVASGFPATITWGDGATSVGVVTGGAGSFSVAPAAGHAYLTEGLYAASVLVTRTADGVQLALGGSVSATEADVFAVTSARNLKATSGQALANVTVATVSDTNLATSAAELTATISWGDGTTSAGVVTDVNGAIGVSGSHTYAAAGSDTVSVTLKETDGTAISTATGAAVIAAPSSGQTCVLDIGLPRMSGLDILKKWRTAGGDFPIVILSARNSWSECVTGLNLGADDYLGKPFQPRELLARVNAQLRPERRDDEQTLSAGAFSIDLRTGLASSEEESLTLTGKELRVLRYMVGKKGRIVSQDELVEHVYADGGSRESNTVEVYVGRLQRRFGKAFIRTVRGLGYTQG